jgi:hypothetical protein
MRKSFEMTRKGFRPMNSKSRLWVTVGLSASAVVLLGLPGCNPHKDLLRPEKLFGRIGRQSGQIIEPRKCMLRVAILNCSFRDPSINEAVWNAADEQAITPEARRALEVNGLRIGLITGEFPPELEMVLDALPPHKVEPATFLLDAGEQTLISISDTVDQVSLLLNRENRPYGKDYQAASGYFRVTAAHDGAGGVLLRFTPEIHHGPVQRSYQAIANAAPYAPQQFKINDGQQEETLRDLATNLVLEPGQVAVVGCRPEQERSLGAFLFTQTETHGEQRRQKLILVWAARNQLGALGDKPAKTDRPVPSADSRAKAGDQGKLRTATASNGNSRLDKQAEPAKPTEIR